MIGCDILESGHSSHRRRLHRNPGKSCKKKKKNVTNSSTERRVYFLRDFAEIVIYQRMQQMKWPGDKFWLCKIVNCSNFSMERLENVSSISLSLSLNFTAVFGSFLRPSKKASCSHVQS